MDWAGGGTDAAGEPLERGSGNYKSCIGNSRAEDGAVEGGNRKIYPQTVRDQRDRTRVRKPKGGGGTGPFADGCRHTDM